MRHFDEYRILNNKYKNIIKIQISWKKTKQNEAESESETETETK
jgi:hypothetical protein